jgi:16S rRNA (uracil1498-N3)-methyltransferase
MKGFIVSIEKQIWTFLAYQNDFPVNSLVKITEDEFRYLSSVLRLNVGEKIQLTNTCGLKALAKIESLSKKEALVTILENQIEDLSEHQIILCIGLPKPSTCEDLVSSLSEMGLSEVHFFRTEKCASKAPVKLEKLQKISNEAVRVSKSAWSTKVFFYESKEEMVSKKKDYFKNSLNLFCDESHIYENKVTNNLLNILSINKKACKSISVFIGPEASFTQSEREWLEKSMKMSSVSLGNNILRVPNAAIYSYAVISQFVTGFHPV